MGSRMGQIRYFTNSMGMAEEKLTTQEINNKLLLGTNYKGRTAWHLAARERNLEILQKVWEWDEEKLKTEEININYY